MLNKNSKIYVAGHTGLVGSAILRKLKQNGFKKIILSSRKKLDLTNQKKVLAFIQKKNQILFLLLQPESVEYTLIINTRETSFMKISRFKLI